MKQCLDRIWANIIRKLTHIRFRPIQVFVFHQVSEEFNPATMWECDWTETVQFKNYILKLKQEYEFIPLTEAYCHMKNDWFRRKKYAVLTCDDGWVSIKSIIPWLADQGVHTTLFLNPAYLKGDEIRENSMSGLLNTKEIGSLLDECKGFISVGSHGWNHDDCSLQDIEEFKINVSDCDGYLSGFGDAYIKYFAYPCGRHTLEQDQYLNNKGIVPVLCDGMKNYNNTCSVHRMCIDRTYLCCPSK